VNGELLLASARAVRRAAVVGPLGAAVVLVGVATPVLDDGYAMPALRGVSALLAMAVLVTVDDPAGRVLAASPYPLRTRTLARLAAVLAAAVPVWLLAAAVVAWRADVPVGGLAVEAVALCGVGLAVAGTVAWVSGSLGPSFVAGPVLLGLLLLTYGLPRDWALVQSQTWGAPWVAAQLRWAALLLGAVGLLGLALRDPLEARRTRPTS
jgi:hypothetical protein